uniref:Uncharacterized protein n=1 Tax=Peromyscus maniculatus bairdii TaxID=230844 RepID=A0A8C8W4W1_PERMB
MLQFLVSGASEDRAPRSPRPLGVPGRRGTALNLRLEPVVAPRGSSRGSPPAFSQVLSPLPGFICSPSSSENFAGVINSQFTC